MEFTLRPDDFDVTLPLLIEAFAVLARHQGWDTQAGAWYACGTAADSFARFLTGYGLAGAKVGMEGLPPFVATLRDFEEGDMDYHMVVEVESLCIDWTRRQYEPLAAFPFVATRKQLEAEGWTFMEAKEDTTDGPG